MGRMKRLRNIPFHNGDDLLYGYTETYTGSILINIQYIWNKYKDTEKFIKVFTKVYDHEVIHLLIYDAIGKKKRTDYGEEYVVRKLLSEPFSNKSQDYYKKLSIARL